MTQELLQIGEFARLANTNLRTLRFYEELGLLQPARRSAGRFRFYSPDQAERVSSIKHLQGLGLTLGEIAELFGGGGCTEGRMESILERQLALVRTKIEQLTAEQAKLNAARHKLGQCRLCTRAIGSLECDSCTMDAPGAYAVLKTLV